MEFRSGECWLSESGNQIGYALANLSEKAQQVRVRLNYMKPGKYQYSGYVMGENIDNKLIASDDDWVSFMMEPWELAVLKTN